MIKPARQLRVTLSLMLPIAFLCGLVAVKQWTLHQGIDIKLPIEGFDPRDLLAGHYLTYSVNYGVPVCADSTVGNIPDPFAGHDIPAYVCLKPAFFRFGKQFSPECTLAIRGVCRMFRFEAGIERFYIPENYARPLDLAVRNKNGEIIVSITDSGTAMVKELLIDGRPWHEAVTPASIR